jgi:hypothetical protein
MFEKAWPDKFPSEESIDILNSPLFGNPPDEAESKVDRAERSGPEIGGEPDENEEHEIGEKEN